MNITRLNFRQSLPFIKQTIQQSHYIAIDIQMSGIKTEQITSPSIMDSMQKRYEKNIQSIKRFIPLQLGLTAFKVLPQQNKIIAYPFNFYIFPFTQSHQIMTFSFHTGTMNFLTKHNFDFNKLFYQGIPYISQEKIASFKNLKQMDNIKRQLKRLKLIESPETKAFIKSFMPTIDLWMETSNPTVEINIKFIKYQSYMLFKDKIQQKYFNQNFQFQFDSPQIVRRRKMIIKRISSQTAKNKKEQINFLAQPQKLFNQILQQMVEVKKPLIVHNGLLDIMHIYYSFYESFPPTWIAFRNQIHKLFPYIYDNKYLFNNSPTLFHKVGKITSLDICFSKIRQDQLKISQILAQQAGGILNQNLKNNLKIEIDVEFSGYSLDNLQCHQAGFDSLMTGYAFFKGVELLSNFQINKDFSVEKLANQQKLHQQYELIRNRIPQGSIKVPFNFQSKEVDIYTKDGGAPYYFRSIYNKMANSDKLLQHFNKHYGAIHLIWSSKQITDFYIIFINKEEEYKFLEITHKTGDSSDDIAYIKIEDIMYLIYNSEQHTSLMSNWTQNE